MSSYPLRQPHESFRKYYRRVIATSEPQEVSELIAHNRGFHSPRRYRRSLKKQFGKRRTFQIISDAKEQAASSSRHLYWAVRATVAFLAATLVAVPLLPGEDTQANEIQKEQDRVDNALRKEQRGYETEHGIAERETEIRALNPIYYGGFYSYDEFTSDGQAAFFATPGEGETVITSHVDGPAYRKFIKHPDDFGIYEGHSLQCGGTLYRFNDRWYLKRGDAELLAPPQDRSLCPDGRTLEIQTPADASF